MSTNVVSLPRTVTRATAVAVGGLLLAGLVSACSAGGSTTTTAPAAQPTGAPTAGASGQAGAGQGGTGEGRGRFDPAQLEQVRQCLEAAGIAVPSFSPRPFPSGSRPSFSPGEQPSLSPGSQPSFSPGAGGPGGAGGFFAVLQEPAAKAALEACGIAVPSFAPRPSGAGGGPAPAAS